MRRYLNPEIALGFMLGIVSFLLIYGVTSYQSDHCDYRDAGAELRPNPKDEASPASHPGGPRSEDGEREEEISNYAKGHPWVCGVIGFPRMLVGYMDHHEGFFVGAFTLALFGATFFLWRSTDKLWSAGERQIEHTKTAAVAAQQAALVAKDSLIASNRAWLQLDVFLENQPLFVLEGSVSTGIAFSIKNIGNAPALQIEFYAEMFNAGDRGDPANTHKEICRRNRFKSKYSGVSIFPNEVFPKRTGQINQGVSCEPVGEMDPNKYLHLYVSTCVDYTFPSDPSGRHQTTALFEFRRSDHKFITFENQRIAVDMLYLDEAMFFNAGRHAD